MDCEQVRTRLEGDPTRLGPEDARHIEACAACRAYAERVQRAEALIGEALRFNPAALRRQAPAQPNERRGRGVARNLSVGIAALLVVGLAFWTGRSLSPGLGPGADYAPLIAEVQAHWYEEPDSWVRTDVDVSLATLERVVGSTARVDFARLGTLSYAQSCLVRGEWVPHLVLQGERGPVMLLLLPHETVTRPQPLALPEEGLAGQILPFGSGSIAVLGDDDEPIPPIRERLNAAIEWSI